MCVFVFTKVFFSHRNRKIDVCVWVSLFFVFSPLFGGRPLHSTQSVLLTMAAFFCSHNTCFVLSFAQKTALLISTQMEYATCILLFFFRCCSNYNWMLHVDLIYKKKKKNSSTIFIFLSIKFILWTIPFPRLWLISQKAQYGRAFFSIPLSNSLLKNKFHVCSRTHRPN